MRRILLAWIACGALAAQTVDPNKLPDTPPLRDYKLPPSTDGTLPNGLKVVLVEDNRYPMVEARIGFAAGSRFDPEDRVGLSEMAAALLTEGAGARDAKQFAEETEALGASISASSSPDSLIVSAHAPSAKFGALLALLADVCTSATFAEDEIRLRKQNRLQELMDQRSQPDVVGEERFQQAVFGSDPYGRTLPTEASIQKTTRADLVKFRDAYLRPNNAVMVLVGRFDNTKAVWRMLETSFGKWTRRDPPPAPRAAVPEPRKSITLVDRPGSVQADIRMGRPGVTRKDADWFPLVVGNTILGGGLSSRLFDDIREKQGFAYHVSSHAQAYRDSGVVQGEMQVRNEVVEPATRSMLGHFAKMGADRVTAKELSDVKNYLGGSFVLGLAKPAGVADQLLRARLNGLTNEYLETYVDKVRRVEPDQIQSAARKYFDPEKTAIVVVGDAKAIQAGLEKIGPVKVEASK